MNFGSQHILQTMENTTPFNLTRSLAHWRDELSATDTLGAQDIAELETHMSASISDLMSKGLTEEEAFIVSQKRLGAITTLASEYGKTNGNIAWQKRLFWMIAGVVLLGIVSSLSNLASKASIFAGLQFSKNTSAIGWTGQIVSSLVFVWGIWRVLQFSKKPSQVTLTKQFRLRPISLTAIAIFSYLLFQIVPYLMQMLLARYLGPTEYGQISVTSNFYGLVFHFLFGCFLVLAMAGLYRRRLAH